MGCSFNLHFSVNTHTKLCTQSRHIGGERGKLLKQHHGFIPEVSGCWSAIMEQNIQLESYIRQEWNNSPLQKTPATDLFSFRHLCLVKGKKMLHSNKPSAKCLEMCWCHLNDFIFYFLIKKSDIVTMAWCAKIGVYEISKPLHFM